MSGPVPHAASGKDKGVAVQEMFEAAFSYTTFSCKSLFCMLEKVSPIKDRGIMYFVDDNTKQQ